MGLNAAGGNLGVSIIQFFLPIVVGAGGAFGLVKAGEAVNLSRAGWLYAGLAFIAAAAALLFMNNLSAAYSTPKEQMAVVKYKHTWVMSFLYIGTFGSFIGYSAAMPLLIKLNFFRAPVPTESIGINFAYYAFLGALVGSIARPFGGWMADKWGGAKVTLLDVRLDDRRHADRHLHADAAQAGTVAPPEKLAAWAKDPSTFPGFTPEVVEAVNHNSGIFPYFLLAFLFVFAATGIGNGSTYRMIPHIWKAQAEAKTQRERSSGTRRWPSRPRRRRR